MNNFAHVHVTVVRAHGKWDAIFTTSFTDWRKTGVTMREVVTHLTQQFGTPSNNKKARWRVSWPEAGGLSMDATFKHLSDINLIAILGYNVKVVTSWHDPQVPRHFRNA